MCVLKKALRSTVSRHKKEDPIVMEKNFRPGEKLFSYKETPFSK
mgnify:CR=1 FL=1